MKFDNWPISWFILLMYSQLGMLKPSDNVVRVSSVNLGSTKFNRLAIHEDNAPVYISSINHLYKLTSDLKVLANITFSQNSQQIEYHNKILVIDYNQSELIACWASNATYLCNSYNFTANDALQSTERQFSGNMVGNYENVSYVAFMGKNLENLTNETASTLYFAISYCGSNCSHPAITALNLNFYSKTINASSELLNYKYRNDYKVKYVYGFNSQYYNYFLTTQKSSAEAESPYISKLIRICNNSASFWQGYTEIPIECKYNDDDSYNLVQAAHVGKPGSQLAKSLNIQADDDVLFGVFSKNDKMAKFPENHINQSALCIYSLNAINEKFTQNIQNCFNGNREFASVLQNKTCQKGNITIGSRFCYASNNMPLDGKIPISASPVITYNSLLTAIVSKPNEFHNDVFIGTSTGYLKNIILNDSRSVFKYADILIDEGSPVNSDLLLSPDNCYLYVMTTSNLTRIDIPVNHPNCSEYLDYSSCVQSDSKYCGWCSSTHKCTSKCDCSRGSYSPWYSDDFRKNVSIILYSIEKFPIGAVEPLKLVVENLPPIEDTFYCTFSFGNLIFNTSANFDPKIPGTDKSHDNLFCQLPKESEIPPAPNNENSLKATVSIHTYHIDEVAKKDIVFIDCTSYPSCEKCTNSKFCQWNFKEEKCKHKKNITGNSSMIHYKNDCKNIIQSPLSILSFLPSEGPWEGGTDVTIKVNKFINISKNIKVAEMTCEPNTKSSQRTKNITCRIDHQLNLKSDKVGPVEINMNGTVIRSAENFTFVNRKIIESFPKQGFIYGGTELTIRGENLNPGSSSMEVLIGNRTCTVFLSNSSTVQCITNPSNNEKEYEVFLKFDTTVYRFINNSFAYVKDPDRDKNGFNKNYKGIPAGGVQMVFHFVTLSPTQPLTFHAHNGTQTYNSSCEFQNTYNSTSTWICKSPAIPVPNSTFLDAQHPKEMNISITSNNTSIQPFPDSGNQSHKFWLYPNPGFDHFTNSSVGNKSNFIIITGKDIDKACQKSDISVKIGTRNCEVSSVSSERIICLPKFSENDTEQNYNNLTKNDEITVAAGNYIVVVVRQHIPHETSDTKHMVSVTLLLVLILILIAILFCCYASKNKMRISLKKMKRMQQQMMKHESQVASECKEAFAELQIQASSTNIEQSCSILPFLSYHTYLMNILFPNINDHSIFLMGKANILIHKQKGLKLFEELINNRRFLLLFVKTLEKEKNFSMNDRVYVASMIMITLQNDMEYCTDILKTLMAELIEKYMRGNGHPKLLLRKSESVVEKMLSAWFSILLYRFLKKSAGKPLFNLFNAIIKHINRGPVDAITSQARYCLSENKLIRKVIEYCTLTIYVSISKQTANIIGLESAIENVLVKVFDCDTISQFIEKSLDAIHQKINFCLGLNSSELNVEWFRDAYSSMVLSDVDSSSIIEGEWRRLNTLKHYGIPDGCVLNLISAKEMNYRISTIISPMMNRAEFQKTIKNESNALCISQKVSLTASTTAIIQHSDPIYKEWHLIKPHYALDQQDSTENDQIIPEIYLTRLLSTKSLLQKFVDELFYTIFDLKNQNDCFPVAIKYMFDFLDDQAYQHDISDLETVHVWKNNCLPLRFWVNLIKNPNFLFDICKSNIADSCLGVIAQVFMDSCSTSEQHLSKDSTTTKLLYAKEIPVYSKLVKKYYADIKNIPKISSQSMNAMLVEELNTCTNFDTTGSVHELFKYVVKYKENLIIALKDDEFVEDNELLLKLERVMEIMLDVTDL